MAKRINLSIDSTAHELLIDLQEKTNSKSFVEVVRKALNIYKFIVEAEKKNQSVYVIDENGDKEKIVLI